MSNRAYPKFPIPGVGVIVVGRKGVLLVRRITEPSAGLWSIPGGAIEVGEHQEMTAVREVKEETGIDCRLKRMIDTFDVILPDSRGEIEYHFVLNHYLAEEIGGSLRAEIPEAEVGWFHLDKLPVSEMPPPIIELLESVKSEIKHIQDTFVKPSSTNP